MTSEETAAPAAEPNAYEALLTPEVKPEPTEKVEPVETEATTQTEAEPEKVEETAATEPADSKPAPGTPDKALQKIQQDYSAVQRTLEAIQAKLDAGQTLTDKEKTAVVKQSRKLDELRQHLADKGFDPIDHGEAMAESVVEVSDEIKTLRSEIEALKQSRQQDEAARAWAEAEKKFPGVDVRTVWANSEKYAREVLGDVDVSIIYRLANKTFEERADAATKSVANKKPVKTTVPVTPNGGRVSMQQTGASPEVLTEEQRLIREYKALLKDD